ncbi:MAG: FAD-binding protein [Flavobacteriaceae bacterium]|nr:FAD-binding protein [Flavobacteriaceae bacterium]
MNIKLKNLKDKLNGELFFDNLHKSIYATDASVYRKIPLAVAYPKVDGDIKQLIQFAIKNKITLIPRTAGTSLAGQCVGDGIVVDVSKHYTKILKFNEQKKTITVQPGVIRDELNLFLKPYKLFFSPNTSTSNRCMLGGMVGNNSSGTTSIQFGVTRDKVIAIQTILSDASEVQFNSLNAAAFKQKIIGATLENKIYKSIFNTLSNTENQLEIKKHFPKKTIHRRNTGYALDTLLDFKLFGGNQDTVNLSKLLCGSEGTLAFTTNITLQLEKLPPKFSILVVSHFRTTKESLEAVQVAMKHNLFMCELMDKTILDCTKNNRAQIKNRFFIYGDPKAILMLEVKASSVKKVESLANDLILDLEKNKFGYAHIKVKDKDVDSVINLRKAGLGVLGNMISDKKSVACVEDTAVALEDLPNYINEFTNMMNSFKQKAIYYAHAGAGELHLRPILNLKKSEDVVLFRKITTEVAKLVKKYKGSLSGEHGDGIVRAEFLPFMLGQKNYDLLKHIKYTFDKDNIFNKGKIIDAFKMDESFRYLPNRIEPKIKTLLNFNDNNGILNLVEKCNGSGDCRKPLTADGVMCPSYRATKDEKDSTRGRANALREFLTNSDKLNRFNHKELKQVFDLCISCKACASECPSNVDIAILKAEFLYQYYKENKPRFRDKLFANNNSYLKKVRLFSPTLVNFFLNRKIVKNILGITVKRNLPKIANQTFRDWSKNKFQKLNNKINYKTIYLFIDEFTNNYDVPTGINTYELLTKLGYKVLIINHEQSGRSQISKGFLAEAKVIANKNMAIFYNKITDKTPLVGIEPSAILTFRDEYLRLADEQLLAKKLAKNTFTIEEFIAAEIDKGNIKSNQFSLKNKTIKIHTHCHQKVLSSQEATFKILNLPTNFKVSILNTGCCGMAGSFGYEKEHYEISMQIGENSVFPKIRNTKKEIEIAVSGTSCRHQIFDGTKRKTEHPISILRNALL